MKKVLAMCAFALFTLAANAQAPAASKKEAKMEKSAPVQTAPAAAPDATVTPAAGETAPKAAHKMNKKAKKKARKAKAAAAEAK